MALSEKNIGLASCQYLQAGYLEPTWWKENHKILEWASFCFSRSMIAYLDLTLTKHQTFWRHRVNLNYPILLQNDGPWVTKTLSWYLTCMSTWGPPSKFSKISQLPVVREEGGPQVHVLMATKLRYWDLHLQAVNVLHGATNVMKTRRKTEWTRDTSDPLN